MTHDDALAIVAALKDISITLGWLVLVAVFRLLFKK